jgi:hypothetical protein
MKPDKTEKAVRFGCGFTFGLVVGLFYALDWVMDSWGGFAAALFFSAVICGLLAMKYGDTFWCSLKRWF